MKKLFFGIFFVLALSVTAQANDSEFFFNEFKDSGIDFEQDGRICEEIAAYNLQIEYGPNFDVLKDIEYSYGGLTIGELDVVVKHHTTGKVILLAEVKCWKSPKGGLQKAVSQRARFENALRKRPQHLIFDNVTKTMLSVDSFSDSYNYRAISQLGGAEFGFDQELPLTLRELTQLRSRLLKCQAFGPCKKPNQSKK